MQYLDEMEDGLSKEQRRAKILARIDEYKRLITTNKYAVTVSPTCLYSLYPTE
jgi:hypothetical protein